MIQHIKDIFQNYQAKPIGNVKEYATLLPLLYKDGEIHILYEVRGQSISHPSDTSFPGGRIEVGESPQEAALREAHEEIGLLPDHVQIIGELDYIVRDFRVVYCYIGLVSHFDFNAFEESEEVSRIFTIPLSTLLQLEPDYYPIHITEDLSPDFPFEEVIPHQTRQQRHRDISVPVYPLRPDIDENLWGLTAQLTHRFIDIIRTEDKV